MFENTEDSAWLDWKHRFSEVYDDSNYASPVQAYVMTAGHKLLENDFESRQSFERLIEIGAGTGEHALHVEHNFQQYVLTDTDEKTLHVAREKLSKMPTPP